MVRSRILVGPEVPDRSTLESLLARLGHYFAHIDPERIVVVLGPQITEDVAMDAVAEAVVPHGFDESVGSRIRRIRPAIRFLRSVDEAAEVANSSDALLFWLSSARTVAPWAALADSYRLNRTMFDVDWRATRSDGSWFAEAAMVMGSRSRRFSPLEAQHFASRTEHLVDSGRAYILGTGPSARSALDLEMSDGVRIACNTFVLDDTLMAHCRPDIVAFADPIFHFGPSTYAAAFQQALVLQAERVDFTMVTVERYAGILRSRLPHLAERIVGVRLGRPSWIQNLDLRQELAVRPHPNVLTMLMLPLATTFANDLHLVGFDGRTSADTGFWRHGPTVQLGRELEEIRDVHPGFFNVDYSDYYDEHLAVLETVITAAEQIGVRVRPRSASFMAPLRRRDCSQSPTRPPPRSASSAIIVSITPDWVNQFGHFGPWERALSRAAIDAGLDHRSLASLALDTTDEHVFPTFSHGTVSRPPSDPELFESQLRHAIESIKSEKRSLFVCFYTADVWHLPVLLSLARSYPKDRFFVNLMRVRLKLSGRQFPGRLGRDGAISLLAEGVEAARNTNVALCLDTEAAVDDLERLTGLRVAVWPMIMVTDPEGLKRASQHRRGSAACRLVAPVQTQQSKGFPMIVDLAERLSPDLERGEVDLAVRFVRQPSGMPTGDIERAARIRDVGARIVGGDLTDDDYQALVGGGDVILLPYRADVFRTRTSGVLLDAIAAGKPVVATEGTWAGDIVSRFGCGVTYQDRDAGSFEAAVRALIGNLDNYRTNVRHCRDDVITRYSPARLVEFFTANRTETRIPTADAVEALYRSAEVSLSFTRELEITQRRQQVESQVRIDDITRGRDDALDKLEYMTRAVAWRDAKNEKRSIELASVVAGTESQMPKTSMPQPAVANSDVHNLVARAQRRSHAALAHLWRTVCHARSYWSQSGLGHRKRN